MQKKFIINLFHQQPFFYCDSRQFAKLPNYVRWKAIFHLIYFVSIQTKFYCNNNLFAIKSLYEIHKDTYPKYQECCQILEYNKSLSNFKFSTFLFKLRHIVVVKVTHICCQGFIF